jgi:hypothetical protein
MSRRGRRKSKEADGRHRIKESNHDSTLLAQLAIVSHIQRQWLQKGLSPEDVTVVTKLLLKTGDHHLLHRLLSLMLEWVRFSCCTTAVEQWLEVYTKMQSRNCQQVHASPVLWALMLSPEVITRLLALLKCPAWSIQKFTLEILQSAVLHLPPEDVQDMPSYAMPHIHSFYQGLSNICNAWPDQSQHAHTAQLLYSIASIQPVASVPQSEESDLSQAPMLRNACSDGISQVSETRKSCTMPGSGSVAPCGLPTTSAIMRIALEMVLDLILNRNLPATSQRVLEPPPCLDIARASCDREEPVYPHHALPSFGSYIAPPVAAASRGSEDNPAIATYFALQTFQHLLQHPPILNELLLKQDTVVSVLREHLESASPFVAAAAAATLCELAVHVPRAFARVTAPPAFAWSLRSLIDRRVQPDTLALNAVPLMLHLCRAAPGAVASCGLVSVLVASVHTMHECMRPDTMHYLTLAVQILLEVAVCPAPLSAAVLHADALGAGLRAVRLTWAADDLLELRAARCTADAEDDAMAVRTLTYIRMDAAHLVDVIKRMCSMHERTAPALLADAAGSSGGAADDALAGRSAPLDGADVVMGLPGGTGGHFERCRGASLPGHCIGFEDTQPLAGSTYMNLLMRAEDMCPGAISVEHALATRTVHGSLQRPAGFRSILSARKQPAGP